MSSENSLIMWSDVHVNFEESCNNCLPCQFLLRSSVNNFFRYDIADFF